LALTDFSHLTSIAEQIRRSSVSAKGGEAVAKKKATKKKKK